MSDQLDIRSIVSHFIEVSETNDASRVPLARDVVYSGPMMPEPLRGEAAVRQHIAEIAPFVARLQVKWMVIQDDSAATVVEFEGLNGIRIEGAEFYRIRDGLISEIRVFFDTRPLIQGSA
jgi:hypothetical protein